MEGAGTLNLLSPGDHSGHSHLHNGNSNHNQSNGNNHHNQGNGFRGVLPGVVLGGMMGYLFGRSRNQTHVPITIPDDRQPFANGPTQRSYRTTIPRVPDTPPEPPLPPSYSHPRHHVQVSGIPPVPSNPGRRWTCSFCLMILFGFIITIIITASTVHPSEMTKQLIMGERYLEDVDGRWLDSLTIAGASDVEGYIFTTKPRVGEIITLPPKRIQVALNAGQYHYMVYNLLGGSTLGVSWSFTTLGLPCRLLIIRSTEAFEQWRTTGGLRSDMKIHDQVANVGEYTLITEGHDNPEYYIIFLQTNFQARTSGTADFYITSNTYALTDPKPDHSCMVGAGDCEFAFKALQEPYYLLLVAPPIGDSYTVNVNYAQRKGAVVAVFVSLGTACAVCILIITVSWCGVQLLYLLGMSVVEGMYRLWLNMTSCCRSVGRRLSGYSSPAPAYDEEDPEAGLGGSDAERQPLLPSAPSSIGELPQQTVVNGQPILPFNPSFYDLPRPDAPPPAYTPIDQFGDPNGAPRGGPRGGPRP
ncbi:hypothetical protein SmJEL517_g01770 [Synchytrium microbalum]|uniref:Uncharacterized protein n=1 Tax=Synchytrium microbalum TaxID=1806994 RepID=A0A507CA31_9FUNG|nr:uncharacterized protein SmJEL517_g01770 [Synchytrium microbalum]TPX36029.1 hypothetical protein SmJEL517_g01770 [Synchytrium microbalum]